MSFVHATTIIFMVLLPLVGIAQEKLPTPDPAGGEPAYVSAFINYHPFNSPQEPPAKNWRTINDDIAQEGGHMRQMIDAAPQKSPSSGAPMSTTDTPQPKPMLSESHLHRTTKGK